MHAFRCKNCGRLHTSDDAAEASHPHACQVCGAGVSFDPRTGAKKVEESNWERLAAATPERLEELGLTAERVEAHTPWPKGESRTPRQVEAGAADGPGTGDGVS